jgi:galactokinase
VRVATAFRERFGSEPEGVWAAPGRVNVIGEHTDYNGGFVLPIALPQVTRAALGRRSDGRLALASLQHPDADVELPVGELRPGAPSGWGGYVAGVVHGLGDGGGVNVVVDGDVPAGAGLSSSAALSCSVALGLRDLLGLDLTREQLVDVARRAENDYVGAPTGILDQSASLLCHAGTALFLDTRDRRREQVPFDLAAAGLALLVVDTGQTHAHAGGGYGDRRRECEAAAARLGVRFLREVGGVDRLAPLDDGTGEGRMLLRRARHVVTENARVLQLVGLLRAGSDPRAIGPVLTAGHRSLRDDFEISTTLLDATVESALAAGAHGARLVGGGFGGSAIALVDTEAAGRVREAVAARFAADGHPPPRVFTAVPSAGARRLV